MKGIQVCSNEEPMNSHKISNVFFSLNQPDDNYNHVFLDLNCFSQVRDVAHWPLVFQWEIITIVI